MLWHIRYELGFTSEGGLDQDQATKDWWYGKRSLLEVPWKIIQKHKPYFDELESMDPFLPIMSNQKMNAYLMKEIADLAGISKSLSYHIARHTFATTVTMLFGVPIESVSKILGHKNIKSTQRYARIIDQKVSNDMKLLSSMIDGSMVVNWG